MKPTKNKIFCRNCDRYKMLFETEKKANYFIKFNQEEIQEEAGYSPQRSYFCLFCGGWHVTSIKEEIGVTRREFSYLEYVEKKKNTKKKTPSQKETTDFRTIHSKLVSDITAHVNTLDDVQKSTFFDTKIADISQKIATLESAQDRNENELKHARYEMQALHIVKKEVSDKPKKNKKRAQMDQQQIDEWRKWAEEKGILKPNK